MDVGHFPPVIHQQYSPGCSSSFYGSPLVRQLGPFLTLYLPKNCHWSAPDWDVSSSHSLPLYMLHGLPYQE